MKILKNDAGHTVYRLDHITDLALVPDDVWERTGGWKAFEATILTLKMMLVCAHEEDGEQGVKTVLRSLGPYIDLVDDGESFNALDDEDGQQLLKIEISDSESHG